MKIGRYNISFSREKRSAGEGYKAEVLADMMQLFGITSGAPGATISTAQKLSAVYQGVRLISEDTAGLPISVYRTTQTGDIVTVYNELSILLRRETDPVLHVSPFRFFSTTLRHALLRGNSYAIIHRLRGKLYRLEFIESWKVNIVCNQTTGEYLYLITGKTGPLKGGYFPASDILHFRGLGDSPMKGVSFITYAAQSLGSQLATQRIESSFYENGSFMKDWLSAPGKVNEDALKRLKETWKSMYGGPTNSGKTPILEEGMKYETVSVTAENLAFLSSKAFGITDIARWLNIGPDKLFDWTKISYASMEQSSANYALQTIAPWVRNIEQEINIKLCAGDEYIKFNLDALIRADTVAKADALVKLVAGGIKTRNEARGMYDDNKITGAEELYFSVQNIPQSYVNKYFDAKIEQMLKGATTTDPAPDPNNKN